VATFVPRQAVDYAGSSDVERNERCCNNSRIIATRLNPEPPPRPITHRAIIAIIVRGPGRARRSRRGRAPAAGRRAATRQTERGPGWPRPGISRGDGLWRADFSDFETALELSRPPPDVAARAPGERMAVNRDAAVGRIAAELDVMRPGIPRQVSCTRPRRRQITAALCGRCRE
jgi:hypothetical protein